MGKITLEVEGTSVGEVSSGGGIRITKEVSSKDSARLIAAYAHTHRERWRNEDGNLRQPTVEEVLQVWWDGIIAGSIAHVQSVEQQLAAEKAAAAVKPIEVQ